MEELCSPHQDACFFEMKQYLGLRANTMKQGCGTSATCRHYPGGYKGSLSLMMLCCSSDLCLPVTPPAAHSGSTNGLVCQSCIGSTAECGLNAPSESCSGEEDRCVQISQRFLPGEELEPIIKGCGNGLFSDKLVAYQTGDDFAFVDQRICKGSNCNNQSFPDILPGKPNGLQCYTCRDSGEGECAQDKLPHLSCTGAMDRCVQVISQDDPNVIIQKGCAMESMCSAYQDIYNPLIRQDSLVACCKTSLCNQAGRPSGPEMLATWAMALALSLAPAAWK
ncbi:hypothetical protein lerEdw1_009889 [Lerista edwardsae]|nr:hypothetical protein lerEdw1_009889 [Lerista edwardsae]